MYLAKIFQQVLTEETKYGCQIKNTYCCPKVLMCTPKEHKCTCVKWKGLITNMPSITNINLVNIEVKE